MNILLSNSAERNFQYKKNFYESQSSTRVRCDAERMNIIVKKEVQSMQDIIIKNKYH